MSKNAFGNYAFALDEVQAQPVEPGYKDIVEDIFPGYWDEQISPQWSSGNKDEANPGTHGYITEVAYDLLRDDKVPAYRFYSGQKTNLIRGSIFPDVDETSLGLFVWHFYGENGKSFNGSSTTAYTKCIEHYNEAVDLYKSGSKSSAMEELGRALHYLQDVNVPHHAMNAVAVLTNHTQFEAYVEGHQESYEVTGTTPSLSILMQTILLEQSLMIMQKLQEAGMMKRLQVTKARKIEQLVHVCETLKGLRLQYFINL